MLIKKIIAVVDASFAAAKRKPEIDELTSQLRLTGSWLFSRFVIQLFQLRLSDHFKLTRQDRRVVWVVANMS